MMTRLLLLSLILSLSSLSAEINPSMIANMVNQNLSESSSASGLSEGVTPNISEPSNPLPAPTSSPLPASNSLASQYDLIIFFRSTCPHCAEFVPVLKQYANNTGFTVIPFSIDGGGEPDYPHPLPVSKAVAERFHYPPQVPALFLIRKDNTGEPILVHVGEWDLASLTARMIDMAQNLGVSP